MAAGGSSAEPEPLGALGARAHGPGPGGPAAGDSPGGGVGGGSRSRAQGPGPLAHVRPRAWARRLSPPAAMYFHKKGVEITHKPYVFCFLGLFFFFFCFFFRVCFLGENLNRRRHAQDVGRVLKMGGRFLGGNLNRRRL